MYVDRLFRSIVALNAFRSKNDTATGTVALGRFWKRPISCEYARFLGMPLLNPG